MGRHPRVLDSVERRRVSNSVRQNAACVYPADAHLFFEAKCNGSLVVLNLRRRAESRRGRVYTRLRARAVFAG